MTVPIIHPVSFRYEASGATVELEAAEGETLLDVAQEADLEAYSECGGVCACTSCHVHIEAGAGNLPPAGEQELALLEMADDVTEHSRLACQCEVYGPVTAILLPAETVLD